MALLKRSKLLAFPSLTTWLLCLIAGMVFSQRLTLAEGNTPDFDQANKLYEAGKYPDAIRGYQALLARGLVSSALYFNLGNAYFKDSQPGEAIYFYRLAERLAPRDPDIRANLRFARQSLAAGPSAPSRFERWLTLLTLNELTLLAAVLGWCWLVALAAGQLRPDWRRSLRSLVNFTGIASVLAAAWLAVAIQHTIRTPAAVVIVPDAPLRYGPFDEAKSFSALHAGAEVTVIDRKDKWLQVRDPARRVGWLQEHDLRLLPNG